MSEWVAQFHRGNPKMARVVGPKFRAMPECEGGGWSTDPETARVIAAAPDTLEALDALLNCIDGVHDYEWLDRCKQAARAAIAKARIP
jgi:hypothetical protein